LGSYNFPEGIVGTMGSYFISVPLIKVWGDPYALYVEGVDADDLRRRMIIKAIRPATIPITATPPTAPPTIAPMFTFFDLGAATGVVVVVEVVIGVVGVLVGPEAGVDSIPPAFSAATTSKVLPVVTSRYA